MTRATQHAAVGVGRLLVVSALLVGSMRSFSRVLDLNELVLPSSVDFGASTRSATVSEAYQRNKRSFNGGLTELIQVPPRHSARDSSNIHYEPSTSEKYVMEQAQELGLTSIITEEQKKMSRALLDQKRKRLPPACQIWTNSSNPINPNLTVFRQELKNYYEQQIASFQPVQRDIRHLQREATALTKDDADIAGNIEAVCSSIDLLAGDEAAFPSSGQLSKGSFGYIEPLLPPLRHPEFCFTTQHVLDQRYLVHDFGSFCRNSVRPDSRFVFVDIGASPTFHQRERKLPVGDLLALYRKFGFYFDHIYAFEKSNVEPAKVYDVIPGEWLSAFHWINVGVDSNPNSKLHPFEFIASEFTEDDFVVVKMDIDTPPIELPLAQQLLENANYSNLVDVFYFEMHVHLKEIMPWWGWNLVAGSVYDALAMFTEFRKKGVASHFWI